MDYSKKRVTERLMMRSQLEMHGPSRKATALVSPLVLSQIGSDCSDYGLLNRATDHGT